MKIAIIGAGAAGCFAAANLPSHAGYEVTIFEKTGKCLQKVKVSGGGRCNVTHACFDIPRLTEKYPRGKQLLRKTLFRFGPKETIEWFEQRGVKIKEEPDGRMFPVTDSSETIIRCLLKELDKNKVNIIYHKSVTKIEKNGEGFIIHFMDGTQHAADKILIATGGYPQPQAYTWLTGLGHTIHPPVPSLFTFNMPKHPITELMGVVVPETTVKIAGTKLQETGPLLITHWGLSGPAVLRTSAWAARELAERNYRFAIHINWLHTVKENELREKLFTIRQSLGKQQVIHKNPFGLPRRFWEFQLERIGITGEIKWGELPAGHQNKLVEALVNDRYEINGKTTFKEEFVTCGGISLQEMNPATMESRIVPGIYFAGEVLDVDGITGGFNFQHAWASGWIAAESLKL